MNTECENEQITKIDVFEKRVCTFNKKHDKIQLSYGNHKLLHYLSV